MTDPRARAFRGFRFPAEVILGAVRRYPRFPVSYRDLEAMLADRGVEVDHATLFAVRHDRLVLGRAVNHPGRERGEPAEERLFGLLELARVVARCDAPASRPGGRTLAGVEATAMLGERQMRAVPAGDMPAQHTFVHQVFSVAT